MGIFTDLINPKIEQYKQEAELLGFKYKDKIKGLGTYECPKCEKEFKYQISAMRSLYKQGLKVNCPCCFQDELTLIQKDLNISELTSVGLGLYTFKYNHCGHYKKQLLLDLRKRQLKECLECVQELHAVTATSKGLLFLGSTGKGTYKYKFIDCGHLRVFSANAVSKGNFRCTECYQIKLETAISEAGLVYIGNSEKGPHYRSCKFKECGHLKEVQVHDMIGRPRPQKCLTCVAIKHNGEALATGLEIIGNSDCGNPNYRKYKTLCCGNSQDIEVTHVRRTNWLCYSCNSTYTTKPNNLYLLEIISPDNRWLKLGYSKDVGSRIERYGLIDDVKAQVLFVANISTGKEASKIEKKLHKKYKKLRIDPEYMRPFFINSGFTECYPLDLKAELLSELCNLNTNMKGTT